MLRARCDAACLYARSSDAFYAQRGGAKCAIWRAPAQVRANDNARDIYLIFRRHFA